MSPVRFVGTLPPAAVEPRPEYDAIVARLKRKPGEWAEVGRAPKEGSGKRPSSLDSLRVSLRNRECRVAQRTLGDDVVIYAMWPEAS